ncbi:MAG: inositol monophosphatase [Pyrinomonadaceae bacterium]|nr:inositol monophosphatase [Pyrinomonadaceae bacterium]
MNTTFSTDDPRSLLEPLRRLHETIRGAVVAASEASAVESLAAIAREEEGDTIYAVDCISEELLIEFVEREIAQAVPVILIGEGLPEGKIVLPRGSSVQAAAWRIIVDPIDGTRGLMYQKRSAWVLTGVAPNRGPTTDLRDIVLAVQTEIPLIKQHLSDVLWAERGGGAHAARFNRLTGAQTPFMLRPSSARSIAHGFAMLARFFPGARAELAAIDDEVARAALGPVVRGKAQCFEDQYLSTGGQLYELMAGHDRFVADVRPLFEGWLAERGQALGICCHPYDLCTEMIAREAGVIVTGAHGEALQAPLDVHAEVAWVGYANAHIRSQIEPALQAALERRGLLTWTKDESSA